MMKQFVYSFFRFFGLRISKFNIEDHIKRENYFRFHRIYRKYSEFTMIPEMAFHDNLFLTEKFSEINGAIVECGVWRGGMIAAMSEIAGDSKEYFLFDSFEGLPEAKTIDGTDASNWQKNKSGDHYFDNCSADVKYAEQAMRLSGTKKFHIVKGWFKDTLSTSGVEKIAVLRLDGDWYDSTMECLVQFYPKVVNGGIIILDDYYFWEGCSRAVHDYLSGNGLTDRIHKTENGLAYIIKNEVIKRSW